MHIHTSINFHHPRNQEIIDFLTGEWKSTREPESASPDGLSDPHKILATHPEMLQWLWHTIAAKLPMDCRWVVFGTPVLIHPRSGVIFGFAYGENMCGLRLSPEQCRMALMAGADAECVLENGIIIYSDEIGIDWVFSSWDEDDVDWCLRAFENAG